MCERARAQLRAQLRAPAPRSLPAVHEWGLGSRDAAIPELQRQRSEPCPRGGFSVRWVSPENQSLLPGRQPHGGRGLQREGWCPDWEKPRSCRKHVLNTGARTGGRKGTGGRDEQTGGRGRGAGRPGLRAVVDPTRERPSWGQTLGRVGIGRWRTNRGGPPKRSTEWGEPNARACGRSPVGGGGARRAVGGVSRKCSGDG